MRDCRTNEIFLRYYFTSKIVSALDAVGLSQIIYAFLWTSRLKDSGRIGYIKKQLRIINCVSSLSKFWVGKKICDDPTASKTIDYLVKTVFGQFIMTL